MKTWIDFSFERTHIHIIILYSRVLKKKITFIKSVFPFSLNSRFYLLVFLTLYRPIKIFSLFPGVDSYVKKKCRTFYLFNNSAHPWDRIGIFPDTGESRVRSQRSPHKRIPMISIGKMHKPLWPERKTKKKNSLFTYVKRSPMPLNVEWHSRILLSTAEIIVQLIYEYGAALVCAYFNIVIITISFVKKKKIR